MTSFSRSAWCSISPRVNLTKLDAHKHFWAIVRGNHRWLTPAPAPLCREFGPQNLSPRLTANGIDSTILVQAAPIVAETNYLPTLVDRSEFISGVAGRVDFEADHAAKAERHCP